MKNVYGYNENRGCNKISQSPSTVISKEPAVAGDRGILAAFKDFPRSLP
jgi:hypothetical protein